MTTEIKQEIMIRGVGAPQIEALKKIATSCGFSVTNKIGVDVRVMIIGKDANQQERTLANWASAAGIRVCDPESFVEGWRKNGVIDAGEVRPAKMAQASAPSCPTVVTMDWSKEFSEKLKEQIVALRKLNSGDSRPVVAFSGNLKSMEWGEAKRQAEDAGWKVMSSVSNRCDVLVVGLGYGPKLRRALELGIRIVDERTWLEMVNPVINWNAGESDFEDDETLRKASKVPFTYGSILSDLVSGGFHSGGVVSKVPVMKDDEIAVKVTPPRQGEAILSPDQKATNPKDAVGTKKFRQFACVPMTVMNEVGIGMLEGARKYGRHNYRVSGVAASVYVDAAIGHIMQWWEGDDIDADSGLSHVTKAICSLVVLRDAMIQDMLNDDRPPKAKLGGWREAMQGVVDGIFDRHPEPIAPYREK